jgi:DNA adenine methylase
MEYISANEVAKKWKISQRRVAILCAENKIECAEKVGNMWLIPKQAIKPVDGRVVKAENCNIGKAKPFVKWAGGKGQLLTEIRRKYPAGLGKSIKKYAEPFVGGGAVLFDILSNFNFDEVYISDVNEELINTYIMVRDNVNKLMQALEVMENAYLPLEQEERKDYYLKNRERYNYLKMCGDQLTEIEKAALFIFLNKTCFNGLYRVNKKGQYNVPMGAYKNPKICDRQNLLVISQLLQKVNIVCRDYRESASFIDDSTFVYIDPPYRPLTKTSGFTAYTAVLFDDKAQKELAEYVTLLDKKLAKVVVSNSDPKNTNVCDEFFDELYSAHKISRVEASRMINSNGNDRGKISELLISNF